MGKFFLGIFAKSVLQPTPQPTPQPVPQPTPQPTPQPVPQPTPQPVPQPIGQSVWWHGTFPETQGYGCTAFVGEPFNPHHPQCEHWHDGRDFGMRTGVPLYAGRDCFVITVGIQEFGASDPFALILWTGNHDIWILHLDSSPLKHGQFVRTGEFIGYSGARGNATGPHVHFQVNPHGGNYQSSVDPAPWLLPFGSPGAAVD